MPAVEHCQHKKVVFLMSRHDGNSIFGCGLHIMDFGPNNSYDPLESGPPEPQKWGLQGVAWKKNSFWGQFWAKKKQNCCLFGVLSQLQQCFWMMSLKNEFPAKKQHFWPQKRPLWAIGAIKQHAERPNGHLPENRGYPELPQDMADIWCHWVGSVWAQERGVIWV